MTLEEKLDKYRKLIFLLELAGLLHDTGKLDSTFIDYRKKWQDNEDGWNYDNDPHDNNYFDNDPLLKKTDYLNLDCFLNKPLKDICGETEISLDGLTIDFNDSDNDTLKRVMHLHTTADKGEQIALFLKLGDSVDSASDRNNPLLSAEQRLSQDIFKTTVFGHENSLALDSLDGARELLYCKLNQLLPNYLKDFIDTDREQILLETEKAFKITVTDTCRPANDIPLWQHSYVTAALTKVFFIYYLFYEKHPAFKNGKFSINDAEFSLFGAGWDGLEFVSNAQKIGDVIARKEIIRELKKKIKGLIEWKYPIGMNIYDDDNGIFFVVPAVKDENIEYKYLLNQITDEIKEVCNNATKGEIQPSFTDNKIKPTHFIMDIVKNLRVPY